MLKRTTITFQVTGEPTIHCAGCEQRIGTALRRLPGIVQVQASAQTQQVQVHVDPAQVSREQVQAKLGQLGYETEEVAT